MRTTSGTPARARGWVGLAVLSGLLLVATFLAVLRSSVPVGPNLYLVPFLAFPAVGAALVVRRPDHLIGKLLVAVSVFFALGSGSTVYVWLGLEGHVTAMTDPAAWLAAWVYNPVTILVPLLVAVFPTGEVASAWLRPWLWVGAVAVAAAIVAFMLLPFSVNPIFFDTDVVNPWGLDVDAPLLIDHLFMFVVLLLLAVAVVDLVMRWRRSHGVERLQMRWAGLGLSFGAVLFAAAAVADVLGRPSQALWVMTFGIGFAALPVAIGIAVARYRLYDIDRVISRTVTYASVLALLVTVYAGGVLLLGALIPLQGDVAVAASTLVAAGLFSPLLRRVRDRVDRRYDRARYDAARVLDGFGARLRHEVDLTALHEEILMAVTRTVNPAGTSLWLRTRTRVRVPVTDRQGARQRP